jgi:UDP-3-O-[3-hydroxymyristoyl] glucosamine N-acyltransferase
MTDREFGREFKADKRMRLHINKILSFLDEIHIEYQYTGLPDVYIEYFCPLSEPKAHSITWIKNAGTYDFSNLNTDLQLILVVNFSDNREDLEKYNIIKCNNPKETFFEILNRFFTVSKNPEIASDSIIEAEKTGKNISVGHHCYICKDVIIGNNVTIKNNVIIECPADIGDNTVIWSGVVIGTDGYGYYKKEDGINYKVPHFGGVKIGKNVEIGANTCIDRGTLADTVIGNNVKIDNLCHIGHNVQIEDNVMIIAMSMLAGSSVIRENAYIAPGSLIINQKTVGKDAYVGLGTVVINNVPPGKAVFGVPARVFRDNP